ncbi:MAG: hypothetical protein H7836_13770 [Magnetococcus sp. YQC-3]
MQRLQQKPVLFIDDKPTIVSGYRAVIMKNTPNLPSFLWTSLEEAWSKFNQPGTSPATFAVILLDLHIPPLPPALKEYERKLGGVGQNHGQALGIWLSEKHPVVPYGYLSVVPNAFNCEKDPMGVNRVVINKNTTKPSQFLAEIERIFTQYP